MTNESATTEPVTIEAVTIERCKDATSANASEDKPIPTRSSRATKIR